MSRIGLKPVKITPEIQVSVADGKINLTGSKGNLSVPLPRQIEIKIDDGKAYFTRKQENNETKALHGLTRSLFQNAVTGITSGYEKKLELVGTGYRVKLEGTNLNLSLGFSHPVIFKAVPGVEMTIEGNNIIYLKGIDKHLVGQVAANIRALRPPEPYKGKGIRYSDEVIRRKAGKTAKGGEK
jgi:large subunit ribosomal protein L6